jgi:hypothetical protein
MHWDSNRGASNFGERSVNICEPHLEGAEARGAVLSDESGSKNPGYSREWRMLVKVIDDHDVAVHIAHL